MQRGGVGVLVLRPERAAAGFELADDAHEVLHLLDRHLAERVHERAVLGVLRDQGLRSRRRFQLAMGVVGQQRER